MSAVPHQAKLDDNLYIVYGPARWSSQVSPISWFSPACGASRKDGMNNELVDKIKVFAREVLLNSKAQIEWINSVDTDVLDALSAFARQFIEKDENTTKMDAFKMGVLLGGVYERMKGIKSEGRKR